MIHVKHRWWPAVVCLLLGLAGGAAHALLAEPRYAASGHVVLTPAHGTDPAAALGFAQAYGRIATDGAVLLSAQTDAGIPPEALRDRVRAATSPDAPVIEITGTAPRPEEAARAANAVARALVAHGNETEATARTGTRLAQLTEAHATGHPVSPAPAVSLAAGACAGAMTGGLLLLGHPPATPPVTAARAAFRTGARRLVGTAAAAVAPRSRTGSRTTDGADRRTVG